MKWTRNLNTAKLSMYIAMIVICLVLFYLNSVQCASFNCYSADIGIFSQYLWKLANFQPLDSSVRLVDNILLDHQHPAVAVLVPLYWIFRIFNSSPLDFLNLVNPFILIFFPTLIISKIVKEATGKETPLWFSILAFLFILFHPYTQNALWSGFHELSLLSVFIPLLVLANILFIKAVIEKRSRILLYFGAYLLSIIACLLVKEVTVIYVAAIATQLFIFNIVCIWCITKDFGRSVLTPLVLILTTASLVMGYYIILGHIWAHREIQYNLTWDFRWNEVKQYHLTGYTIVDVPSFFLGNLTGLIDVIFRYGNQFTESPNWHHGSLAPVLTVLFVSVVMLVESRLKSIIILGILAPGLLIANISQSTFKDPNNSGYFRIPKYFKEYQDNRLEFEKLKEIVNFVYKEKLDSIATSYTMLPFLADRNNVYFETGNNEAVYSVGINKNYKKDVKYLLFPRPGAKSCFAAFFWSSDCKEFEAMQLEKEVLIENEYFKLTKA